MSILNMNHADRVARRRKAREEDRERRRATYQRWRKGREEAISKLFLQGFIAGTCCATCSFIVTGLLILMLTGRGGSLYAVVATVAAVIMCAVAVWSGYTAMTTIKPATGNK